MLDMIGQPFERLSYERGYDRALFYLYNLQKFGIKFGLSKTENLLKAFDNPHRKLKCLHIAGSNGKGSVAAMLASIYSRAGYKVGLFSSPHLVDFRERFQINGRLISKARTLDLIQEIRQKTDPDEPPTFFEFVTAMALIYFYREKVDLAVMEVGLGGRLDATNIIHPLVSVITTISLEHQDYLGKTLEKIAQEKAGIVKPGVPLVTGVAPKKVRDVIEKICRERKAPMLLAGRDFRTRKLGPGEFSYFGFRIADFGMKEFGVRSSEFGVGKDAKGTKDKDRETKDMKMDIRYPASVAKNSELRTPNLKGLQSALLGDHQIKNAGLALTTVDLLQEKYPVLEEKIREGLKKVSWPGRMEVLSENPKVILDGAHNPEAMKTLAKNLPKTFSYKKLLLVFGMMKDKNIKQTMGYIIPFSDKIFLTRAEYDRSADPDDLRRLLPAEKSPRRIFSSIPRAITQAMKEARPADLILITGSLFVVGEARAWWEKMG
jgi:dihydrofolate synthase / folylpolyglutamate synthase